MAIIFFRRPMQRWLTVAALLFLALPACGQTIAWKEKTGPSCSVYFHSGDEANVAGLIQTLAQVLPDLQEKLGVVPDRPASIYLASSQGEFDHLTEQKLPTWSQGVSFPETGSIVLKSPQFSHDVQTFQTTAAHEMAHLLIARKAGIGVPRWLNEGLALMLSGEGPGKPLLPLSRAIWSGKLISLDEVEQVDVFPHSNAELAYVESYNAVEYLVKQYGWEALRRILGDMGQNHSWNEALFRETELDQAGFEAAWRTNLEKSYRWMILLDAQTLVFVGMTALVLVIGVIGLRRRRKIYRQWEAEEGSDQVNF
jgi:hypothetical protein